MKPAKIAFCVCFVLALVLAFCLNSKAELISVSQSSFGASTLHEYFNEPIDYSNAVNSPDEDYTGSMVVIGSNSPYTFSNTATIFSSPVPNVYGSYLPIISAVKGNQYIHLGTYGELLEGSGLIPGAAGAKFLLEAGSSSDHFAPFVLTFPGNGVSEIGGDFIMSGQTPGTDKIIVTAYDGPNGTGTFLGAMSVSACNVSDWASNFLGITRDDGLPIRSIGIDYSTNFGAGNPGIANLMFVPAGVPEPSTIVLLFSAAGLFGLRFLRRTI